MASGRRFFSSRCRTLHRSRRFAEPWFLAFNAGIEIHPVMLPDDLAKAGDAIEKAVKKYC
jgi:hypothetical protein